MISGHAVFIDRCVLNALFAVLANVLYSLKYARPESARTPVCMASAASGSAGFVIAWAWDQTRNRQCSDPNVTRNSLRCLLTAVTG